MVLVLGAGGMLGTAIVKSLIGHELPYTALASADCDITDKDAVMKAVEEYARTAHSPLCINCAAYTKVDLAEIEKEKAFTVNETGARNVAEACAKYCVPLVHPSTDYVFDGEKKEGYLESDKPRPLSVYGESKLAGEKAVEEILSGNGKYFIVRTSWLYGPNGKNFVNTIDRLLKEKPLLNVVNDQTGSPTYTKTLALCILQNFSFPQTLPKSGIYHLTNAGTTTWYEFAKEIAKLTKSKTPIYPITTVEYPLPAKRPKNSTLINTKLPPLRDWQTALRWYVESELT